MSRIHANMSMREAEAVARDLGVTVTIPRRTGEALYVRGRDRIRVNSRKKDAGLKLVAFLRRLERG